MGDHDLRAAIDAEVHSRPPLGVVAPCLVHHVAFTGGSASDSRSFVLRFCDTLDLDPPETEDRQIVREVSGGTLKWERHGEFETFTLVENGLGRKDLEHSSRERYRELLKDHPAGRIVACRVEIGRLDDRPAAKGAGDGHDDDGERVVGASLNGGLAVMYTDFRIGTDGFTDIRIAMSEMSEHRAGRLLQRVLEIETYRFMAMLGLSEARKTQGTLTELEADLTAVSRSMENAESVETDRELLDRIQALAGRCSSLFAATTFRFSASRAYGRIVRDRLEELRETRIEGHTRPSVFLARRMEPAIATCEATEKRRDDLERRLADLSQLLRTRVDIGLADQQHAILQTIEKSATTQVRLQKAVEGLSVVAISYYLIGILAVLLKGGEKFGLLSAWEVWEALIAPVAIILVFLVLRRVSHTALKGDRSG